MKSLKGLRSFVTGGLGFIGSHLVDKLLQLGVEVIVLDNFSCGGGIKNSRYQKALHVYKGDVRDRTKVKTLLKDVDILFHMAFVVGVERAFSRPLEVLSVAVTGTENVLECAATSNVKRVVFASSSEVYGDFQKPLREDDPCVPKSTYGLAKLIGEEYCKAYHKERGLDYVCLRYFNAYGPRQDSRFVIPRFICNALRSNPIKIYGDGNQTRDFTYIDDAVNMTILAATKPKTKCEALNLGTGVAVTITDLAELILNKLQKTSKSKLDYIPYNKARPVQIEYFNRVADVSKAKQFLDYKAKVSLENGLSKTIEWFQDRL